MSGLGTFWDLTVLGPRGDVTGMKELCFVPARPPAFLGDTPKDQRLRLHLLFWETSSKDHLLLAFPLLCFLFVRNMLTDEQKIKMFFCNSKSNVIVLNTFPF